MRRGLGRSGSTHRFSVSLNASDYERLRALAEKRRPALTLQYVIEYALQLLFKAAEDPKVARAIGDPLADLPAVGRHR